MKKRILVWPANTEIGLEIGHAFKGQTHFEVIGASSGPGPADFVFDDHQINVPDVNDNNAYVWMRAFCAHMHIDFVYPAHDQAAVVCVDAGVPYIGSPPETVRMCRSKRATYEAVLEQLNDVVPVGCPYRKGSEIYIKPNIGQGGKGHIVATFGSDISVPYLDYVAMEVLPGNEYTIDCLTDRHGVLQFVGARKRNRISNGICVESEKSELTFRPQAQAISDTFKMRGAWFFQTKEDKDGIPTLLEISVRPAGSSGFHRAIGVNLPLLAAYDACGMDIDVMPGKYTVSAYRSLTTHFTTDLEFDTVYCDWDDTVMCESKLYPKMYVLLLQFRSEGKGIVFVTRSKTLIHGAAHILEPTRIHYLKSEMLKSQSVLKITKSIFIDDSHAERKEVHNATGIPVFSPQQAIDLWLK